MSIKNPPHPGVSVRHDCIEIARPDDHRRGTDFGRDPADPQQSGQGKSGVSADMAIRLGKAFGSDAEAWLRLQMAYDLAQARQHEGEIKVRPVARRKLHEPRP